MQVSGALEPLRQQHAVAGPPRRGWPRQGPASSRPMRLCERKMNGRGARHPPRPATPRSVSRSDVIGEAGPARARLRRVAPRPAQEGHYEDLSDLSLLGTTTVCVGDVRPSRAAAHSHVQNASPSASLPMLGRARHLQGEFLLFPTRDPQPPVWWCSCGAAWRISTRREPHGQSEPKPRSRP